MRCIVGSNLTLKGLVGRLIAFELANFDNYTPLEIDIAFGAQLTIEDSKDKKKKRKNTVI